MAEKKRRQYGTGSVFQRDGRWMGTAEAGYTRTGSRRRVTVTGKTEAEVKRKLRDKLATIETEKRRRKPARRANVKGWADDWLILTERELRPKTWATNRSAVNKWIVPTIGQVRLDEIGLGDVRAVETAMRRQGAQSPAIKRTRSVLVKMLRDAVSEGGHQIDPTLFIAKPRKRQARRNDREALSLDECLRVVAVANQHLPHASRWQLALLQGLRQGESLGLQWSAVDLDAGLLTVEWQLQALPYVDRRNKHLGYRVPDDYDTQHLEGAFHLVRPKTSKSERIIPLVEWAVDALTEWRKIAPESPHDLVWTRLDGRPIDAAEDRAEWKAIQATAEVGHPAGRYFHVHEIRNSTATLLLEAGIDPFIITAIMGHTDIETSRSYMRLRAQKSREAMEAVADSLRLSLPAA